MSISSISAFFSKVLPINTCQTQAIELFGNNLAESLYKRDQSWEKVMLSWNISLEAWKLIKESKANFCIVPSTIYCEIQSNEGLIVEVTPTWDNANNTYSRELNEARLITPYGSIDMKFTNNESMNRFIDSLAEKFHKQSLPCGGYTNIRYSFTSTPDTAASFKPSYYFDQCGHELKEEFGKNEYTRTQTLAIYDHLRTHANIEINGQDIA